MTVADLTQSASPDAAAALVPRGDIVLVHSFVYGCAVKRGRVPGV